jgi:hypothetical protein
MRKLNNRYILTIRADDVADVNDFNECRFNVETSDESLVWGFDSRANMLAWLKRNPEVVVEAEGALAAKFEARDKIKCFDKLNYERKYELTGKDDGALTQEEKDELRKSSS